MNPALLSLLSNMVGSGVSTTPESGANSSGGASSSPSSGMNLASLMSMFGASGGSSFGGKREVDKELLAKLLQGQMGQISNFASSLTVQPPYGGQ